MVTKLLLGAFVAGFTALAAASFLGSGTPSAPARVASPPAASFSPAGPSPQVSQPPAPRSTPLVTPVAETAVIRHDIAVAQVDSTASQAPNSHSGVPNNHLVLLPERPWARKGRLFLLVVGTGISETTQQEIVYAAARRGYHAITIAYPNNDAVAVLCAGSTDDDCTYKVREEILTGVDLTPIVSIAPQDSLETRLRNLLIYLRATYPSENWGQFLRQNQIDWSTISAAGHSQGAGHVALLAKRHDMFRAVMISGVADVTVTGQTAPWLFLPNVTPVARQYGFTHVADYVVPIAIAEASWQAIGLQAFGPTRSVDGQQPDFGGSHMLSTALLPASGVNFHVAMVDDRTMARAADGSPAHLPVWAYIAFP